MNFDLPSSEDQLRLSTDTNEREGPGVPVYLLFNEKQFSPAAINPMLRNQKKQEVESQNDYMMADHMITIYKTMKEFLCPKNSELAESQGNKRGTLATGLKSESIDHDQTQGITESRLKDNVM